MAAAGKMPDEGLLEDLSARFIMNVPREEIGSFESLMFLVEQAAWFYEDFYREKDKTLRNLGLREFAQLLFNACPELYQLYGDQSSLDAQYRRWREYKIRIPCYGCIILNEDNTKAILVKGWKASSGWSFPKGKINKDEKEEDCAAREVEEEIGLDVSHHIRADQFIEAVYGEQKTRLYIVAGLPEDTPMLTQTRKEISDIAWVRIQDLPTTKEPNRTLIGSSGKAAKFFLVLPFVARLKKWIKQNRKQHTQQLTKEVHLQQQQEAHQTQPVQILRPPMSLEDVELAMMRDASRQAAPAQQQRSSMAGGEVGGERPPPSSSPSSPTSTPTFRFRRDLVMTAFDGAVVAAAAPSRNAIAVNAQPR